MNRPKAKKARQGFDAFVMEAADPLFRSGYLMTADTGETEDLLQETFLRVARHWNRVRLMEFPLAYARRILMNLALDEAPMRSRRNQELQNPEGVPQAADHGSVRVLSGIDDQAEFEWALATLRPRHRAVLILRYWDGLSEREVAGILGCPIGTVKSSASRGVSELRRLLGRETTTIATSSTEDIDQEESSC